MGGIVGDGEKRFKMEEYRFLIEQHFQIELQLDQWVKLKCPFHKESRPSAAFMIKEDDGIVFNCFVCGSMSCYDVVTKLQLNSENDRDGAIIPVNKQTFEQMVAGATQQREKVYALRAQVQEYADFLIEKGLDPDVIESVGGYYVNNPSNNHYGHLVVHYGVDKEYFVARKILNLPDKERFNNSEGSKSLLGIERVRKFKAVILVEGLTDWLTLLQMGYENVVASLSSKLSRQQAWELRGKTVFILYDLDFAGSEGADKAKELLKEKKATPIVLELPERFGPENFKKIDPNSAYLFDKTGFKTWLDKSIRKYNLYDATYVDEFVTEEPVRMVSSGIIGLDHILTGGYISGVHALAGEPKVGKTTLICELIDNFTAQKARVLACSYEISKPQMYARLASRYSQFTWEQIEKDRSILEPHVVTKLRQITQNLRIDMDWSIEEIEYASDNFDVVIVDYIQRMPDITHGKVDERQMIKMNNRSLSNLSKKNKIIILVSSMNRASYGKENSISIFKETGDIEYTIQSGMLVTKVSPTHMSLNVFLNTRGLGGNVFCEIDYAHQRTVERTFDEVMQGKVTDEEEKKFGQLQPGNAPPRDTFSF